MFGSNDNALFVDGGAIRRCCCTPAVAFLSLRSGTTSILVAIQDGANAPVLLWVEEIFPTASSAPGNPVYTSMRSHDGILHLAINPVNIADPSVFRFNETNGATLNSAAILAGAAKLGRPGITVNNDGDIHVCGGNAAFPNVMRLDSNLNVVASGTPAINAIFSRFSDAGRQRVMSSTSGGDPCVGSDTYAFRLNKDCTYPGDNAGRWKVGQVDAFGPFYAGAAPSFKSTSSPDVIMAHVQTTGSTPRVGNVTSFNNNAATDLLNFASSGRLGTFATNANFVWLAVNDSIMKMNAAAPTVTHYTKVLGTDLLADLTWTGTTHLEVLRHQNGNIWILAVQTSVVQRAILACYMEGGTDLVEKWRLDLRADPTIAWTGSTTRGNWRGWVLNCPGNGYDDPGIMAW